MCISSSRLTKLEKFYKICEKCNDDMKLVAYVFVVLGCKRKPESIEHDVEESKFERYTKFFDSITFDTIVIAKRKIQIEEGKKPTLF